MFHKPAEIRRDGQAGKDLPRSDHSWFVLVHQNIDPVSPILDRGRKVRTIDWSNAGAYATMFEAAALHDSTMFGDFNALFC